QIVSMMGVPVEKSFPLFHGGAVDEELTLKIVNRFRERYTEESKKSLELFPGIAELLPQLKAIGSPIGGVCTKRGPAAIGNMQQLKIDEFIEEVVGAHDVKNPKPDPEPLRVLCRRFGRYPDPSTLVVGDASFDIEMANRAGAYSCAVTWGAHTEKEL